jgi:hypothetical protein
MATDHYEKYGRKWYEKNKEKQLAANARVKQRRRKEWAEFKATLSCTQCGENHPATLDFHHTDPTQKDNGVYRLISSGHFKRAHEEIKKCIVLCANCHRKHHYEERQKLKDPPPP